MGTHYEAPESFLTWLLRTEYGVVTVKDALYWQELMSV